MRKSNTTRLEELERENELLRAIIDKIHEGVFAVNAKDEVILYNFEVEKFEGMKREEVLGKTQAEAFTSLSEYHFEEKVCKKIIETGKPVIGQQFQYTLKNGRKAYVFYDAYPFYYKGTLAGIYSVGRNMPIVDDYIAKMLEMNKRIALENNQGSTRAKFFFDDIIGSSEKIKDAVLVTQKAARHNSPVLLIGETGTGKELFAQGIHNASLQANGPFVPVNCAAIPDTLLESMLFGTVKGAFTGAADMPGLFEQAEDGTIFLDEINSMPVYLQAKLLRVLQDKIIRRIGSKNEMPINCRIISASNVDPFTDNTDQVIRPDLLFRLSTLVVKIPSLRERKEDMNCLCMHIIGKYNIKYGLFIDHVSDDLMTLFKNYQWPGNVRELENVIESSMNFVEVKENVLKIQHLLEYVRNKLLTAKSNFSNSVNHHGTLHNIMKEIEKKVIEDALKRNNWNVSRTADQFGILRQNLHQKIRKLGIK